MINLIGRLNLPDSNEVFKQIVVGRKPVLKMIYNSSAEVWSIPSWLRILPSLKKKNPKLYGVV